MGNLLFRTGKSIRILTGTGWAGICLILGATALLPVELLAANANMGFSGRVSGDRTGGLAPLSADIVSFADEAGLRLIVSNPGARRSDISLIVYDENFLPTAAEAFPERVTLASGDSTEIIVIVPFAGSVRRHLNICAERLAAGTVKRRACGRYTIRHESLD